MAVDWLDQFHDSLSTIFSEAVELRRLASAFSATGNAIHAKQLSEISQALMDAHGKASDAVAGNINDRCVASEQSARETLGLVLGHILRDPSKEDAQP